MIYCSIPGYGELRIEHCVSDFSGTLSEDGHLLPGIRERINILADKVQVHILTADTHGRAGRELEGLRCVVRFLASEDHTAEKRRYTRRVVSPPFSLSGLGFIPVRCPAQRHQRYQWAEPADRGGARRARLPDRGKEGR